MSGTEMDLRALETMMKGRKPAVMGVYDYYSVLVPLVEQGGELYMLFEVRSDALKRQPGEVCFPGGKVESDETEQECALRETSEELGIPYESMRIVAQLDTMYTYSNFTMYAFLGVIDYEAIQNARVNPDEVKSFFLVPFSQLMEYEPYVYNMDIIPDIREDFPYNLVNFSNGYNWRKGKSQVPIYQIQGQVIWGLTARIVHNLVTIVQQKK